MNLKRRLADLKERIGIDRESLEDAVTREVISCMSTEELREYRDILKRLIETGELVEEDAPILHRWQQLYEEVSREFAGAQA
jgi:hypothetical protein